MAECRVAICQWKAVLGGVIVLVRMHTVLIWTHAQSRVVQRDCRLGLKFAQDGQLGACSPILSSAHHRAPVLSRGCALRVLRPFRLRHREADERAMAGAISAVVRHVSVVSLCACANRRASVSWSSCATRPSPVEPLQPRRSSMPWLQRPARQPTRRRRRTSVRPSQKLPIRSRCRSSTSPTGWTSMSHS